MKKITFLLLFLCSTISFGQNLLTNGGFENFTGGVPDNWSNEAGAVPSQETTTINEGSSAARYSVNTQTQANTDVRQSINLTSGVTYDVSFDVYQVDNKSRVRMYNGAFGSYSDPDKTGQWQTLSDTYTASTDGAVEFGLRFYDISANWDGNPSEIIIDNFQVVAQTTPSISITSPADASTIPSSNVNIEIAVANFNVANGGTGDGYITYILDSDPSVDKFDTTPIPLTGLSEAAHSLTVELVDNSGASLTPAQTATVNFTVSLPTNVSDIASLRAGTQGNYYTLTGEAVLTFQQSSRNQKYIQDNTGAILIDDNAAVITTIYNVADGITGITGRLSEFSGVLQLIPSADPGAATSNSNTITPQVVNFTQLTNNLDDYESEIVQVTGVTFTGLTGGEVFAVQNYTINDGSGDFQLRAAFGNADYIGEVIPTSSVDITGIAGEFNGTSQLYPRNLADIVDSTLSIGEFDRDNNSFKIYPNPVYDGVINFPALENKRAEIKIYNVLGAQVASKRLDNSTSLNVANLSPGVYLVQLFENNRKVATEKLIIQ